MIIMIVLFSAKRNTVLQSSQVGTAIVHGSTVHLHHNPNLPISSQTSHGYGYQGTLLDSKTLDLMWHIPGSVCKCNTDVHLI